MPDKSWAFIDRRCPRCSGEGTLKAALPTTFCPRCKGTGMISELQQGTPVEIHPTPFSELLRSMRIRKNLTVRELSLRFGMSPSRLSGLENGLGTPTSEEEKKIREWMEANND